MSKGTKQIRFGRIEKIIEELRLLSGVHTKAANIPDLTQYDYGYHDGYKEALKLAIQALEELNK